MKSKFFSAGLPLREVTRSLAFTAILHPERPPSSQVQAGTGASGQTDIITSWLLFKILVINGFLKVLQNVELILKETKS
jgi:hypothetical protein